MATVPAKSGGNIDIVKYNVGVNCKLLSPVLVITFMDRISRRSQGSGRILPPLIGDDGVLFLSSKRDRGRGQFAAEWGAAGMKISTSKCQALSMQWLYIGHFAVYQSILPSPMVRSFVGYDLPQIKKMDGCHYSLFTLLLLYIYYTVEGSLVSAFENM